MERLTFKRLGALVITLATMIMVMGIATTVFANGVSVTVDGEYVIFTDQEPVIIDSRTLVPVRGVFEMLGFDVD